MKIKARARINFCTSTTTNNEKVIPVSSTSASPESIKIATNLSLQSHDSLQTLPSVLSLQSVLDTVTATVTVTHSLSSTLTLPSSITSLSLSSTSSNPDNFLNLTSDKSQHISESRSGSKSGSRSLVYASSGGEINVYEYEYNSATWTQLETISTNSLSTGAVKSIAFSNGNVLTAHQDGKIRVWNSNDKKTGVYSKHKLVSTLPTLKDRLINFPLPKNHVKVRRHKSSLWLQHNDAVSSLFVTKSGIYSVSWDKTLKIWSPKDLRCKESVSASEDAVNAVTVSVDGVVYTGSAEGRIKVFSDKNRVLETVRSPIKKTRVLKNKHELIATLEKHKSAVNALTLTDDGSVLFSGACDRSILVWEKVDNSSYMTVSGALRGHDGAILCLIHLSDFLISGSADRTVRIWRRGHDGKFCCLTVLTGHNKAVKCLDARMEGEDEITVFSGGLDGEIKVWSVKINRS